MLIRAVFILSFGICASAQSETLSGTVEGTARLNVVFPELDLKTDNIAIRRQLQAPMVDPSGLQSKETNSLRLLQLQMEILRMQDMVKRQLAEENSRAQIVTRKTTTTTTTTEAAPKKVDSDSETEDSVSRLGRLLESLSGGSQKKTGNTFQLDGIQDEIESLQKQLGKITANRARNANESKVKSRVTKKTPRVSYFDVPKEGSKPRSSNDPQFRSRESDDDDVYEESVNDTARAASSPSLLNSLEKQLLKYQHSINNKQYVSPKYSSMYPSEYSKDASEKNYKQDTDFEDIYQRRGDFNHGHRHNENLFDEKYENSHITGEVREFTPNLANPITNLLNPVQVNVGEDAHNAVLDLVLEIVRMAAGGDGRGLLGAVVRLPAMIVRGLIRTMVSALARGGLRGLIIRFLIPLIVLVAVNLLIVFLAWWLWEDGNCDVANNVELQKNFHD